MRTFEKPATPAGAKTLESRWYTSPDIFQKEQQRIFSTRWICVGRARDVERPGQYFLANVAGESLIVVNDTTGTIRALYNVCRHRGSRVCEEPAGAFRGSIQCGYHAWTYALDGTLLAARNMDGAGGFEKTSYPLHRAAVALFDGFIFVNLDARPQPFASAFGPIIDRFARWHIGELICAKSIRYELACNWKLVFQNYSECYHCPLVHPQLDKLSPSDSGRNDLSDGPFLGGYSLLRSSGGSLTTTGRTRWKTLGEVSGDDLERVYYYTIFPSMLLSLHPDYVMVHYVRPSAADRTEVVCEWLFDPEAVAAPGFDPSDAVEFWDLTNRQDWHVNELTQLGVSSRAYTPGPYSQQEGLLHAFDRHYLEIMAR